MAAAAAIGGTGLGAPVRRPAPAAASIGLPNQLSIFRLLLTPAIIASLVYYSPERDWLRYVAFGLFALGMVSDALDGWIARTQHLQTRLGILLDPIADKVLILGTLISCSVIRGLPESMSVPAWFNLIVLSRDAVLVAGATILFVMQGRWTVQPTWLGKCTTVSQMLVIPSVLLGLPVREPLIVLAAVMTVLSGMGYIRNGLRALNSS